MLTLNEPQLIQLMQPDLPIKAFPGKGLLPALRGKYPGVEITTDTELEIHSVVNMGIEGGVCCEITPSGFDRKKAKEVVLCSITHLRIKRGEPHLAQIVRYQVKRVKKLQRQNRLF